MWCTPQIAAKPRFKLFQRIVVPHREVQQRQSRSFEYSVHKLIALLPVSALVTAIIQFDAGEQPHGTGFTEYKVNMLADDPVQIGLPLRRLLHVHIENIYHPNFGTYGRPATGHLHQPVVEL